MTVSIELGLLSPDPILRAEPDRRPCCIDRNLRDRSDALFEQQFPHAVAVDVRVDPRRSFGI